VTAWISFDKFLAVFDRNNNAIFVLIDSQDKALAALGDSLHTEDCPASVGSVMLDTFCPIFSFCLLLSRLCMCP
jgi:hypothetical protein